MQYPYIFKIISLIYHATAHETRTKSLRVEDNIQTLALSSHERKCCSGVSYDVDPNPNIECCGNLLYDSTLQTCCNGSLHELKPNFQCCGTDYHSPNDGLCCPAYYLGTYKFVAFSLEIVDDEDAKKNSRCCGIRLYDITSQICCEKKRNLRRLLYQYPRFLSSLKHVRLIGEIDARDQKVMMSILHSSTSYVKNIRFTLIYRIHRKQFPNSVCCNGDIVIGDEETNCTHRAVRARFFNRTENRNNYGDTYSDNGDFGRVIAGYCVKTKFNLLTHLCCAIETKSNNRAKMVSKVRRKTTPTTYCCGLNAYDYNYEICCKGKTYKQNDEGSLICCGDKIVDESKENCDIAPPIEMPFASSNETCEKQSPEDDCCGNKRYNISDYALQCCRGYNPSTLQLESTLYPNNGLRCCGNSLYNPSNETCCGVKVYPRITYPESCCGNVIYNPEISVCCNDTVFEVNRFQYSCCGFSLYSRDSQFCCDDKLYSYRETDGRLNCCTGKRLYDYRTQVCCNDVINVSVGLAKRHSCC